MRKTLPNSGQTLLSVIVGMAVLTILAQALFTLSNTSYQLVTFNRARIAARHIAQNKIELIRNLPYDEIGTSGGIPSGSLIQEETINSNGLVYNIRTNIIYIDDVFDGESPDDLLPTDYKRVRVEVSWDGLAPSRNRPIVLTTDMAPQGIETTEGGGTLSILVFDANGIPVPQANVTITTSDTNPLVNLSLQTNDNGRIVLPGAPECNSCYTISATKENYSLDKTYTDSEVSNPNKPPISIIEGGITETSFTIDRVSTLTIRSVNTRENNFAVIPNFTFTLSSDKSIGTDINDLPVLKYSEELTTNSIGEIAVEDLEWGNYIITLPTNYVFTGSNPLQPLPLLPDTEIDLVFSTTQDSGNNYFITFTNGTNPIGSVSATLTKYTVSQTIISGGIDDPDFGQVFFANLGNGIHDLIATMSGYIDYSVQTNITNDKTETIIMNPN